MTISFDYIPRRKDKRNTATMGSHKKKTEIPFFSFYFLQLPFDEKKTNIIFCLFRFYLIRQRIKDGFVINRC